VCIFIIIDRTRSCKFKFNIFDLIYWAQVSLLSRAMPKYLILGVLGIQVTSIKIPRQGENLRVNVVLINLDWFILNL